MAGCSSDLEIASLEPGREQTDRADAERRDDKRNERAHCDEAELQSTASAGLIRHLHRLGGASAPVAPPVH